MLITLIIGLPASGKTSYAYKMITDVLIDDPRNLDDVKGYDGVESIVITDPYFCVEETLHKAVQTLGVIYLNTEFEFVYFENNPENCLRNAKNRPQKKTDNLIKQLSKVYNPPSDAIPVKDYSS